MYQEQTAVKKEIARQDGAGGEVKEI